MGRNMLMINVSANGASGIDDEDHPIFTCAAYNHIGERYADLLSSNHHDLKVFLEQRSTHRIALFLTECRALSL